MRRKRLIRATTGLAIIGFGSPGKRGATGECRGCGANALSGLRLAGNQWLW
ncbi:MAG: hypothetical protein E6470_18710 [Enterobacteriaceae bacterium]|nr:hypothetical protein [Enterobacteriaceae bacterium]